MSFADKCLQRWLEGKCAAIGAEENEERIAALEERVEKLEKETLRLKRKVRMLRLGGQIKFFAIAAAVITVLFLLYQMIQSFELKFGIGGGSGAGIGMADGVGIGAPKASGEEGVIKIAVRGNTYEAKENGEKLDIDELAEFLEAEEGLKAVRISDEGATLNGYNRLIELLENKDIKYTEEDEGK